MEQPPSPSKAMPVGWNDGWLISMGPILITTGCLLGSFKDTKHAFNVKPVMNQVPRIKTVARDMECVPVRRARHLGRPQYHRLRQNKNEQPPR